MDSYDGSLLRASWWAETLMELYTVVLIAAGLRRRLDQAGWAVGITATLAVLPPVIYNVFQLSYRWDLGDRYTAPLFTLWVEAWL